MEGIFDYDQKIGYLKHRGWPATLLKNGWHKYQKMADEQNIYVNRENALQMHRLQLVAAAWAEFSIGIWCSVFWAYKSAYIHILLSSFHATAREKCKSGGHASPVCLKWIIRELLVYCKTHISMFEWFFTRNVLWLINEYPRVRHPVMANTLRTGIGSGILGFKSHIKRAIHKRKLSKKSFSAALLRYRSGLTTHVAVA